MADTSQKQLNQGIRWTNGVQALVLALYDLYTEDQRIQASGIAWSDEVIGAVGSPIKYTTATQMTASQTLVRQLLVEMNQNGRKAILEAVAGG